VVNLKQTWREKRLDREENGTDGDDSQSEDEKKHKDSVEAGREVREVVKDEVLDVNKVFIISAEFCAPEPKVAEVAKWLSGLCLRSQPNRAVT
jgi:hypothetical protein